MDVRLGLILLTALVAGAIAAGLRVADGASWPSGLLTAGAAAGATVGVLVLLMGTGPGGAGR
ncbi:hypothetical protein NE857_34125 (plasmid) [Nocardiopsis exhalans]|uniref:Uncharacterized protein n=1 Tax=Nocardiopsis exhalans TaxID=163604 RepID=A0ABY5DHQ1_9ACTN|nr:hypothetical protein [Nocardiopsis exhalans]USY23572.1 hypothetical protein NE857_34125 [Nocardiopsis exhalans]